MSKTARPENCRFTEKKLDLIDRFGLIPLAVFAGVSVLCSFFNVYEWGKNMFNVLFMALAALSLTVYEVIILNVIKNCRCAACSARLKTSWILFLIGLAGFLAGLTLFLIYN